MTEYDKPFITYEEMILKLQDQRGLIVNDVEQAIKILGTMSYYDLVNGYKECFMDHGRYKNDVTIEFLYIFHDYDRTFQNILFKYSTYVEKIFKNHLSYVIAKNIGVDEQIYLNKKEYSGSYSPDRVAKLERVLYNLQSVYQNNPGEPTLHYHTKKNHIPPWILFKNAYFNDVIDLYSFLKEKDKIEVINFMMPQGTNIELEYQKEFLKTSLTIIRKFRNTIAHNLKFITKRNENASFKKKTLKKLFQNTLYNNRDSKKEIGLNDPFAMILGLVVLLNDKALILRFKEDLSPLFKAGNVDLFKIYCEYTNIPEMLIPRLEKYIHFQFPEG